MLVSLKYPWKATSYPVWMRIMSYLGEANVGRLFSEALTADVQAVLADETSRVRADTAIASQPRVFYYSLLTSKMSVFSSSITYHSLEPLP